MQLYDLYQKLVGRSTSTLLQSTRAKREGGMREFDYIVVGAGSVGCVLARRLSEQPGISVALVEAGPREEPWTVRMPAAVSMNIKGSHYNWNYRTEPQGELGARTLYQ